MKAVKTPCEKVAPVQRKKIKKILLLGGDTYHHDPTGGDTYHHNTTNNAEWAYTRCYPLFHLLGALTVTLGGGVSV